MSLVLSYNDEKLTIATESGELFEVLTDNDDIIAAEPSVAEAPGEVEAKGEMTNG